MTKNLSIRDITCHCARVKGTILGTGPRPSTGHKCECLIEFNSGKETTVLIDSVSIRRGGR